ncbi:unnamed protein product [Caenorhabditis sp. 36 PRJEB53466]|nr:unnamed protein product [Caenorhabditis sp. 36 PRJEB53466]
MGGGESKEVKNLKDEQAANDRRYANEHNTQILAHQAQSATMDKELARRNDALDRLRKAQAEANEKNENELRATRAEQAKRAAELQRQQDFELSQLRDDSEAEKLRVRGEYAAKAEKLEEEHKAEVARARKEQEDIRKQRDEEIRKAESERGELQKRKAEEVAEHKKKLETMAANHRKEVNEQYDRMLQLTNEHTQAAVKRIADETSKRMAIVDVAHKQHREDTITAIYQNIYKEYMAIQNRGEKLKQAVVDFNSVLEVGDGATEVPYEIREMNSEFGTESALMNRQVSNLRQRITNSFDISEEFKNALMEPLEKYTKSCNQVQGISYKVILAVQNNNLKALEPIREALQPHQEAIESMIAEMNAQKLKEHVEETIKNIHQKKVMSGNPLSDELASIESRLTELKRRIQNDFVPQQELNYLWEERYHLEDRKKQLEKILQQEYQKYGNYSAGGNVLTLQKDPGILGSVIGKVTSVFKTSGPSKEEIQRQQRLELDRKDAESRRAIQAAEQAELDAIIQKSTEQSRQRVTENVRQADLKLQRRLDDLSAEEEERRRRNREEEAINRQRADEEAKREQEARQRDLMERELRNAAIRETLARKEQEERLRTENMRAEQLRKLDEVDQLRRTKMEQHRQHIDELNARNAREKEEQLKKLRDLEDEIIKSQEEARSKFEEMNRKCREQMEILMEAMKKSQMTRTIEANWNNRLQAMKSTEKRIGRAVARVKTQLAVAKYKETNPEILRREFDQMKTELSEVKKIMDRESDNLEKMYEFSGKQFVLDIGDSLRSVSVACTNFSQYLDAMYNCSFTKEESKKVYNDVELHEERIVAAYKDIPTIESLKEKHASGWQSSSSSAVGAITDDDSRRHTQTPRITPDICKMADQPDGDDRIGLETFFESLRLQKAGRDHAEAQMRTAAYQALAGHVNQAREEAQESANRLKNLENDQEADRQNLRIAEIEFSWQFNEDGGQARALCDARTLSPKKALEPLFKSIKQDVSMIPRRFKQVYDSVNHAVKIKSAEAAKEIEHFDALSNIENLLIAIINNAMAIAKFGPFDEKNDERIECFQTMKQNVMGVLDDTEQLGNMWNAGNADAAWLKSLWDQMQTTKKNVDALVETWKKCPLLSA